MASWHDLKPGRLISGTGFRFKFPKGLEGRIEEVDIKSSDRYGQDVLAMLISKCHNWIPLSNIICEQFEKNWGADTDDWIGKRIFVTTEKTKAKDMKGYSFIVTERKGKNGVKGK